MLRVQTTDGTWSDVTLYDTFEELAAALAEVSPDDAPLLEVERPHGREWVFMAHVVRVIEVDASQ